MSCATAHSLSLCPSLGWPFLFIPLSLALLHYTSIPLSLSLCFSHCLSPSVSPFTPFPCLVPSVSHLLSLLSVSSLCIFTHSASPLLLCFCYLSLFPPVPCPLSLAYSVSPSVSHYLSPSYPRSFSLLFTIPAVFPTIYLLLTLLRCLLFRHSIYPPLSLPLYIPPLYLPPLPLPFCIFIYLSIISSPL